MPISLRLPADVETQIASFGARLGISKSAVIVRSIQEFLAAHTHPTSLQIYEEAMRTAQDSNRDTEREVVEQRPHKLQVRTAIARKHAQRSKAAAQAQTRKRSSNGESA
jgi:hypothetical protein